MFISAIQGVDAAVDAFTNGMDALARRRREAEEQKAVEAETSAWQSAQQWHDYALSLERHQAVMTKQMAALQRDSRKQAQGAQATTAFFVRYTSALTSRITELDNLYQSAAARAEAGRLVLMEVAFGTTEPSADPRGLQRATELAEKLQRQFDEFMGSTDVRLGVPDSIDFLQQSGTGT
jgi:hypothetical protein